MKTEVCINSIEIKTAEDRLKYAESELKLAEARKSDGSAALEYTKAESERIGKKLDVMRFLAYMLTDSKPGFFESLPGVPIFEDENERKIIRDKILSIVKTL